jgi:hypothetical protein
MFVLLGLSAGPVVAEPWKFMVFGDSRGFGADTNDLGQQINTNILGELVAATTNEKPAFILIPGDLVHNGNVHTLQMWTNFMAPVYNAGIGVYPYFGNHDDDGGYPAAFTNVLASTLPGNGPPGELFRTYAVRHQNVLVLAIDAYLNGAAINTNWVDSVLSTNNLPHIFSFTHKPAFKLDSHDTLGDGSLQAGRDAFWRSLERVGSVAYFCGHVHAFDHARMDNGDGNPSNDVHQYAVGTGGAPLDAFAGYTGNNSAWTPQAVTQESQYGYLLVEIDRLDVSITWKHRIGPGQYAATSDVFRYHVLPRQDTLQVGFGSVSTTGALFRVAGLTASATNTIESSDDLTSGAWSPLYSFESWSSVFEWPVSFTTNRGFYRARSE